MARWNHNPRVDADRERAKGLPYMPGTRLPYLSDADLIAYAQKAFDRVSLFPDGKPGGTIDLIVLRNIVPVLLDRLRKFVPDESDP